MVLLKSLVIIFILDFSCVCGTENKVFADEESWNADSNVKENVLVKGNIESGVADGLSHSDTDLSDDHGESIATTDEEKDSNELTEEIKRFIRESLLQNGDKKDITEKKEDKESERPWVFREKHKKSIAKRPWVFRKKSIVERPWMFRQHTKSIAERPWFYGKAKRANAERPWFFHKHKKSIDERPWTFQQGQTKSDEERPWIYGQNGKKAIAERPWGFKNTKKDVDDQPWMILPGKRSAASDS